MGYQIRSPIYRQKSSDDGQQISYDRQKRLFNRKNYRAPSINPKPAESSGFNYNVFRPKGKLPFRVALALASLVAVASLILMIFALYLTDKLGISPGFILLIPIFTIWCAFCLLSKVIRFVFETDDNAVYLKTLITLIWLCFPPYNIFVLRDLMNLSMTKEITG